MRVAGVLVLACAAAGCITRGERPAGPVIARSLGPIASADGLFVESVLVERPVGDPVLDRELWAAALSPGSAETRALLAENGLRVGVVAGAPPARFLALLESTSDTVDPHGLTFNARKEAVIPTVGPIETCSFALLANLGGKPRPVEFRQANCGVLVRPQRAADGRIKLSCEPQVQNGDRREWFRPNEDGTGLTRREGVPVETYPGLAFEAVLGPEDYLVVGWQADRRETLGEAMFRVQIDDRPRQRLLVVRARPLVSGGPAADLPPIRSWGRR